MCTPNADGGKRCDGARGRLLEQAPAKTVLFSPFVVDIVLPVTQITLVGFLIIQTAFRW